MQGATQVAVEAGVAKTVMDKDEYERRKTINKAQANVSWWKFQKLFGFGPLANTEK